MANSATELVYELLPAREGQAPHPLLVLLHGRGANEYDLLPLAQDLDPRCMVISARAPLMRSGGYHWYDLEGIGVPEPTTYAAGLAALSTFLTKMVREHPVDPTQVYLLGFSQGAMMSGSVLLTDGDRLAGAMLLSGYLPTAEQLAPNLQSVRGKPVFWGHGVADPVLAVSFGRAARDVLQGAGAVLTYREYPMAHQISERELADVSRWLTGQLDQRTTAPQPRG